MRKIVMALSGVGVAVLYGGLSFILVGSWNCVSSLGLGVLVTLVAIGFQIRLPRLEGRIGGGQAAEPSSAPAAKAPHVDTPHAAPVAAGNMAEKPPVPQYADNEVADFGAFSPPLAVTADAATADDMWHRACALEHNIIPTDEEDAAYLELVHAAAEGGHVAALAKLGEYAFLCGNLVEAYFWTRLARRRAEDQSGSELQIEKEIDPMLLNIRREWMVAGQPLEYENVDDEFPEERGELGRAFLRIDSHIEVRQTWEYIQVLAEKGNPDALLFV